MSDTKSARPELMVVAGDFSGKRFAVSETGLRLGRSTTNDISIPDEELSRNHCMFERAGESEISVLDFGSANGTFVNGAQLGGRPHVLKIGDLIEAGKTRLRVVAADGAGAIGAGDERGRSAAPGAGDERGGSAATGAGGGGLDLGFERGKSAAPNAAPKPASPAKPSDKIAAAHRRRVATNMMWCVAAALVAGAAALVKFGAGGGESAAPQFPVSPLSEKDAAAVVCVYYEKVEASSAQIFRYQMTIDESHKLRVVYDDVPTENRHLDKSAQLGAAAMKRMAEIFDTEDWEALEPAYVDSSATDENSLKSARIRVVRGSRMKEVYVENMVEPDEFAAVRGALEAFSRNQLGIWAIQYSRSKLLELSAESEKVGDGKMTDREVELGNLSEAVKAFREAIYYLDTVNPKPENYQALKDKLKSAERELERRYKDQRFLADKALTLKNWPLARTELRILLEMIPDAADDRHKEAKAKLVDVENRIKNEQNGGNQ